MITGNATVCHPKYNKSVYKGSCYGYDREGHTIGECHFILKVEQCLAYLKANPKAGKEKAAK